MRRLVVALSLVFAPAAVADDSLQPPGGPVPAPAEAAEPPPAAPQRVHIEPAYSDAPACTPMAKRAAQPGHSPAQLSAKIGLANCLANARVAKLDLLDTQESMQEVEAAMTDSLEILDDVIEHGDAALQIQARHATMLLWQAAANRMIASVPPPAQHTVEAAQLRDARRGLVESMIAPWRETLVGEATEILAAVKAHPKLAKNAVVASAVRDSRRAVPEPVASR